MNFLTSLTSTMQKMQKMAVEASMAKLPEFSAMYQFAGADGASGIAIDEPNGKVCLVSWTPGALTNRVVTYRDIISCALFEDGETITKTVRSSQIGGAVAGGLLLGGAGAVIGGLSGKRVETRKIKRIDLRLVINDVARPAHDVCFLAVETNREASLYKAAADLARQWQARIDVLIKRAEREEAALGQQQTEKPASFSVADEQIKLAELRNAGILTDAEFAAQKAKLLGGQ